MVEEGAKEGQERLREGLARAERVLRQAVEEGLARAEMLVREEAGRARED